MKLLTGTIALSISFILFIYLYGLKADFSSKYKPELNIFPLILFVIALACFISHFYENSKKQERNENKPS